MTTPTIPLAEIRSDAEQVAQSTAPIQHAIFSCPACGQSYGPEEDYCPVDGAKLRPLAPAPVADDRAEIDAAASPTSDAENTVSESTATGPLPPFNPPHWSTQQGHPTASPAPEMDKKERSLFDTLKKRLGITPPRADDPARWQMPPEVAAQGWTVSGPVESHAAWDRWPLVCTPADGKTMQGQLLRYRTGSLTSPATYQALQDRPLGAVGTIHAHGTTDLAGARFDYEVTHLPAGGQPLSVWLSQTTPGEARAHYLAPLLARLLTQLAERHLQPWVLYPELLWLHEDRLSLNSIGAVRDLSDGPSTQLHYSAALHDSALLKRPFAAPELLESGVSAASSPLFSVGQILSVALWGTERTLAEIGSGALPFALIQDPRLSRWLMGCLWPRPDGRWQLADFQAALTQPLEQLAALPAWASLMPGAATRAFRFAGQQFWRAEDLLHAAMRPAYWLEATEGIERLLHWLEQTAWAGQAALLRKELHQGKSVDWVLIRLIRTVVPDAPLTWRGHDFSDAQAEASLVALAQAALAGGATALQEVEALFTADLRGAFVPFASATSATAAGPV